MTRERGGEEGGEGRGGGERAIKTATKQLILIIGETLQVKMVYGPSFFVGIPPPLPFLSLLLPPIYLLLPPSFLNE